MVGEAQGAQFIICIYCKWQDTHVGRATNNGIIFMGGWWSGWCLVGGKIRGREERERDKWHQFIQFESKSGGFQSPERVFIMVAASGLVVVAAKRAIHIQLNCVF